MPHRAAIQQDDLRLASMTQSAVQVYELDYHNQSQGFFFALGNEVELRTKKKSKKDLEFRSVVLGRSAALLPYRKRETDALDRDWRDSGCLAAKPLLKAGRKVRIFRMALQDAAINAAPGEFPVTPCSKELTGTRHGCLPFAEKH